MNSWQHNAGYESVEVEFSELLESAIYDLDSDDTSLEIISVSSFEKAGVLSFSTQSTQRFLFFGNEYLVYKRTQ